jgi:hypothetical protein
MLSVKDGKVEIVDKEILPASEQVGAVTKDSVLNIGDGVTICYYSDCHAFTVVKLKGKKMWLQKDKATLKEGHKPDITPGGFAGHCNNNHELQYDYEPDIDAYLEPCYLNKKGDWKPSHNKSASIIHGRHKFHDYNF